MKLALLILSNVSAFNSSQNNIELLSYDLIKNLREKYSNP